MLLSHAKFRSGSKGLHCDRQYQTEDTGKEAVKQSGNHMKCEKMLQSTDRPFDHIICVLEICAILRLLYTFTESRNCVQISRLHGTSVKSQGCPISVACTIEPRSSFKVQLCIKVGNINSNIRNS